MEEDHVRALSGNYEPHKVEQEIFEFWEREKIYEKAKNKGEKKFYFLDGPPYVTNPIHVGTAWNKIMKDVICRFRRMQGYLVRDQPGYDCHGLPIEVQVERMLGIKHKWEIEKMGLENFIKTCKEFALKHEKILTQQFKNLGVWMDWENPYMTLTDEYIESAWWWIKKAYEKGLLVKGKRVVHWCPRCETTLSGYEITDEYRDVSDPSIYVKFPVVGKEKEYIVIWTTTPWTLPANVAVMVHPHYTYARVKVGDEVYIMALERVPEVMQEVGIEKYEILERFPGSKLEGLKYRSPLAEEVPLQAKLDEMENAHIVVLSEEYVTLTEGSGCVHSAPGHGEEDYEVGLEYNLPMPSPVDSSGRFTEEAGKYAGLYVKDADKIIIEDLKRKGYLLYSGRIVHKYPHCWRCKSPLILRLTDQWFIKITAIKKKLLEENEKVFWVPRWAGFSRFKNWLENAKDWVISRQRYWNTPLPVWVCEKCGNEVVIGSKEELLQKAIEVPEYLELHRPWVDKVLLKCEKCGGVMRRVPDVLDVWLDSGIASFASLNYPKNEQDFKKWFPADVVLEGHDQTRGWFYTLLCTSVLAFDVAPYKAVVMHGFALDAKGNKMSKSLGNFVAPEDVIERFGRDILRLYLLQNTTWEDLRFNWEGVEEVQRIMNVLWNVFVFATTYMELDKFSPKKYSLRDLLPHMAPEDRWMLSRINSVVKSVTKKLDEYLFHEATRELLDFIVEDVSHWYIRLIRRRVWIETEDIRKTIAYAVLYDVLKKFILLLAPLAPFITEKLYQFMVRPVEPEMPESVHLCRYPDPDEEFIDKELEKMMSIVREIVSAANSARQAATPPIKIRQPLSEVIVLTDDELVKKAVERLSEVICDQSNVKEIKVLPLSEELKFKKVELKPRMNVLGPKYKDLAKRIAEELLKVDAEEVLRSIGEKGTYELRVNGRSVSITEEDIEVEEKVVSGFSRAETRYGKVYLNTRITRELKAEGLAREVIRRLQEMRKQAQLKLEEYVRMFVQCPSEEDVELLNELKDFVSREVRASQLMILKPSETPPKMKFTKEWNIDESKYVMGLDIQ
ncbi:MAG: isoleucine--tRNA ligase [Candidatus Baldrarchaeia archaeon]